MELAGGGLLSFYLLQEMSGTGVWAASGCLWLRELRRGASGERGSLAESLSTAGTLAEVSWGLHPALPFTLSMGASSPIWASGWGEQGVYLGWQHQDHC